MRLVRRVVAILGECLESINSSIVLPLREIHIRHKHHVQMLSILQRYTALVQIAEFGRVHWSFGELRTGDEQAEQHGRVVCRAAL
jgi:hypothetical protein